MTAVVVCLTMILRRAVAQIVAGIILARLGTAVAHPVAVWVSGGDSGLLFGYFS